MGHSVSFSGQHTVYKAKMGHSVPFLGQHTVYKAKMGHSVSFLGQHTVYKAKMGHSVSFSGQHTVYKAKMGHSVSFLGQHTVCKAKMGHSVSFLALWHTVYKGVDCRNLLSTQNAWLLMFVKIFPAFFSFWRRETFDDSADLLQRHGIFMESTNVSAQTSANQHR